MPERELIRFIRSLSAGENPAWLTVPAGDDAAEIELPGGRRLLVTTDMLIEGVHFAPGTPPEVVGHKAVARAHSDTAAMAARPLATFAAASFGPEWDETACRTLCKALHEAAQEIGAPLVGGDISSTEGPLTITVTALGTPGPAGAVTRSGAQVGDVICVTGALGGSLRGRHLDFMPRIAEALELVRRADVHAMIDLSDGLSTDLSHIADMSGVGVEVRADAVPVSEAARETASESGREALWHALNDGEDYELLFCVAPAKGAELAESGVADVPVSVIGRVVDAEEGRVLVRPDGTREEIVPGGWEHLAER